MHKEGGHVWYKQARGTSARVILVHFYVEMDNMEQTWIESDASHFLYQSKFQAEYKMMNKYTKTWRSIWSLTERETHVGT